MPRSMPRWVSRGSRSCSSGCAQRSDWRRGKITRRQREILQLLAIGESTTVAARQLDLSEETVKTHLAHIYQKLGVNDRVQQFKFGGGTTF